MEREQVRKVLTILRINYPQSFRDYNNETAGMFLDMWTEAFKNDPADAVVNAVKAIIYSDPREFAPNIAQVKQKMMSLSGIGIESPEDVWAQVRAVLRSLPSDSPDDVRPYWEKLPSGVKRIYTVNDLIDMAFHRTSAELSSYELPRFRKVYESVQEQELIKSIEISGGIRNIELPDAGAIYIAMKGESDD